MAWEVRTKSDTPGCIGVTIDLHTPGEIDSVGPLVDLDIKSLDASQALIVLQFLTGFHELLHSMGLFGICV